MHLFDDDRLLIGLEVKKIRGEIVSKIHSC